MILVLDNYDSFTFNLVQYLGDLGADPTVIRNDEWTVQQILAAAPSRIVISPGPGVPTDAGITVDLIRAAPPDLPVLGVCLGHQAIAEAFGGRTVRADVIMHGKTAPVRHRGDNLFRGIPSPLTVARYHSLVTDPTRLPPALVPIAWTDDDRDPPEVQGLRHRERPVWGLQFHPESHFSQGGRRILANFLEA